ncbi:uncharacterized protein FIBRA_04608 [Fibroporia radiculosa]|uniref:DUF4048 domain-containing protein n=1 Tax=Fibroporia radiculosa TaxID=599839 RepID=J4IA92_9APHY|nr:uncharacterized protein FIBRA_04608 [Fibroporia radiculosa]CCM02506.1 predicted protein [Fibroporia radiculosa]
MSYTSRRHSSGPRPLQLVDGNVQPAAVGTPSTSSCPSPTISGLSTPPPTSRNFKSRRQSSISYYPSNNAPTWDSRSQTSAAALPSLTRSLSLGHKAHNPAAKGDRRSVGSADLQSPRVERAPLTLTEKHADLLQFIAQKESKCLELRSQLAIHEAELAELKRKWERIVSRGMDRAYSNSPSSSSPISGALSPSANGAVLENIREGVQGVGRLLVSGLGDLSSPASPSPTMPVQSMSGLATISRASIAPAMKRARSHANTQSTSSVSTSGTTSTHSTSVRLSQSSISSFAFDEPLHELDEKATAHREVPARSSIEISPSRASEAAKLHRRRSRDHTLILQDSCQLDSPPLNGVMSPKIPTSGSRSKRASLNLSSGLPPAAIPGMSTLAVEPLSAWVETVGSSMGRKWEELQKGQTFTKSQKRASMLLSDVSQSFFSALASPAPSSTMSVSVSTNPFGAALSPLSAPPYDRSPQASASTAASSLLEDEDELQGLGNVMVPDSRAPASPGVSKPANAQAQSDDEWNW